jgi:outer membrane receptor protein involved in Fe transport
MRSIIIILVFLIFTTNAIAQVANHSISGKVIDNSTKTPLQYATVSLIDKATGKAVNGSIADESGSFSILRITHGSYKLNISFIGYEETTVDSIIFHRGDSRTLNMGTVFLSPSARTLESVTVVGDKPIIENKIDKIVYNVANDVTSQGGLATDVLKKVPNVTVDLDGNVELQGNSNIKFLINGKPSSIFGSSVSDALASIPASQIKSIEAITSPGAKYDAQGTGGIINIILQHNTITGINGNINLSAGTRLENGSGNLNFKANNIGFNVFFGGRAQLKSNVINSQFRESFDTLLAQTARLTQDGTSASKRDGFRSGAGFDWNISKSDNLTGSLGFNQFRNINSGTTYQEQITEDQNGIIISDILTERRSESNSRYRSLDLSLNYKKTFEKEGQELDVLVDNSYGTPRSNFTQTQIYSGEDMPYSGSANSNPGTDNTTNFSIDYAHPFTESFLLETGAKTSFQMIRSIAEASIFEPAVNDYVSDPFQSYNLKYNMNVYAGYLSFTVNLLKALSVKTGVRYEATDVKINFPDTNIPSYGTVVPNVVLSYNLTKTQSVKLSYNKRIERPGYRDLNPFTDISDPYYITTGNPLLKPEIGNNFELGYNTSIKKTGNINVSIFERINRQNATELTTFYPSYLVGDSIYENVSVTSRQNIGKEYNSGLNLSVSYPVTSRFRVRAGILVTHRKIVSDLSAVNINTGVRSRVNMNLNYELPKDLVLEVFGFYNSPSKSIQGKVPQFFIYNFAFRKLFWDKNASFGFTTTNVFNKYIRQVRTVTTEYSSSNNITRRPFRSFGISFTYKFGKMESRRGREDNGNQIQDLGQ